MFNSEFIINLLQITFLDLALCADNIGIIALATRNLSKKHAQIATLLGIGGAIILRIIFACFLTLFLQNNSLPINFIGGIILLKVTWDLLQSNTSDKNTNIKESDKLFNTVLIVLVADVSMSIDNVLAIAGTSEGNVFLITLGILLNIPIIFFGSQFIINLMNKSTLVIYIGAAILAHTSVSMILKDIWFSKYVHLNSFTLNLLPLFLALSILVCGLFEYKYKKKFN